MWNLLNPDEWKRQWEAFVSAPYVMFPLLMIAGFAGWWLRGTKSDGIIAALNVRITGFEDQLKFAATKIASANKERDEINDQLQAIKTELAANAGESALAARVAKIEAAIEKWSAANKAVETAIGILETADARVTIQTEVIRAEDRSQ
jgi:septal ring factor EnvC (AmiA/AmiB activator)